MDSTVVAGKMRILWSAIKAGRGKPASFCRNPELTPNRHHFTNGINNPFGLSLAYALIY